MPSISLPSFHLVMYVLLVVYEALRLPWQWQKLGSKRDHVSGIHCGGRLSNTKRHVD